MCRINWILRPKLERNYRKLNWSQVCLRFRMQKKRVFTGCRKLQHKYNPTKVHLKDRSKQLTTITTTLSFKTATYSLEKLHIIEPICAELRWGIVQSQIWVNKENSANSWLRSSLPEIDPLAAIFRISLLRNKKWPIMRRAFVNRRNNPLTRKR